MTFPELEDELARIKAIADEDEQRDAVFAFMDKQEARDELVYLQRLVRLWQASRLSSDPAVARLYDKALMNYAEPYDAR